MLDTLRTMLADSALVVNDIQGIYIIHSAKDVYAENYVEIELLRFKYAITKCSRASKKTYFHTKDKNWACALGVILAKKFYEDVVDRSIIDTLTEYATNARHNDIANMLTSKGLGGYFRTGTELYNKISLTICDDNASVKYGREYIVKDISVIRGFVVLYNYASMLKYFTNYFDTTLSKFIAHEKYFELSKVYLLPL